MASELKLLANKTVLLTGASRGIGSELAKRLTEEGASKLILVAHPWHKKDLDEVRNLSYFSHTIVTSPRISRLKGSSCGLPPPKGPLEMPGCT